ncbi:MAG: RNHCP domain-containing protein [Parcubacteria group bacterium]|nr:RNHCP domain-containing protein [Parcubacteria group bacterium]
MSNDLNNVEFICSHCGKKVTYQRDIGTEHRNHCPYCLWSQHEDLNTPGDRKSNCHGQMEPIGLTFKKEGQGKYGQKKQGELMLIHQCLKCGKISINRLAGDDDNKVILEVFEKSKSMDLKQKQRLENQGIEVLSEKDRKEILIQLYGVGVDIF